MDGVRHVHRGAAGREVPRRAQVENLSIRQHGLGGKLRRLDQPQRLVVELQAGQHLLVADAAPGVLVDPLDQLGDRMRPVSGHVAGHPLRRRHHLAVDDQDPVVVPLLEGLDDHHRGEFVRLLERDQHLLRGGQVDRDPLAVVAVERLDHHGIADPFRGLDGVVGAAHPLLARHGEAEVREDLVGQPLVRGDVHRGVARLAGDGRLDAALVLAVAELHERALVQADPRHVPLLGGAHQGGGRGAEGAALGEADEILELGLEVVGLGEMGLALGREQVEDQAQPQLGGLQTHHLLLVAEDHVILAARQVVAARLAVADRRAGEALELDRHVLQHVAEPGPLLLGHAAHEAARLAVGAGVLAQRGDRRQQRVDEAGEPGGRIVLELAEVDAQADHLAQGVEVGATVDAGIQDLHRLLFPISIASAAALAASAALAALRVAAPEP